MKLNHLNLCVPNVLESRSFYEQYFGFQSQIKGSDALAILKGPDEFLLVLSNLHKEESLCYPKDFHVGFTLNNEQELQALFNDLKGAGFAFEHEPQVMREKLTFYFYAPGAILTEVSCSLAKA